MYQKNLGGNEPEQTGHAIYLLSAFRLRRIVWLSSPLQSIHANFFDIFNIDISVSFHTSILQADIMSRLQIYLIRLINSYKRVCITWHPIMLAILGVDKRII